MSDVIDMDIILCDACADWVELKVSTGIRFGACLIFCLFFYQECIMCIMRSCFYRASHVIG